MKQCVFLLIFSVASLLAQVTDYFPLVPGSTWIYRAPAPAGTLTIRVGNATTINGVDYYRVEGYQPEAVLLRLDERGNLIRWDESTRTEALFLRFDGTGFSSTATPCRQTGTADTKPASYKGPIGSVDNARIVRYSGGVCADAGLTRETFIPWLGLVERAETTFIGERTIELVYAQIGGVTYLNDAGVAFSITATPTAQGIAARLVLHNRTDRPFDLNFRSTQFYNFQVRNAQGDVVYTWSADKIFLQVERKLTIRGEEVWADTLPVRNLPAGFYSVTGELMNSDGRKFLATTTINLP
jgi:hypothetical protein